MDEKMLELLYRSFDDELSQREKNILDEAMQKSSELKSHKEEMMKIRESLGQKRSTGFRPGFADRVMQKIGIQEKKSGEELFFDSIISVFRPFAIAAAFLLVFLISYNIISQNGRLFNGTQNSQDITLAEAFDPFNELTTE